MLRPEYSSAFPRDYKKCIKKHWDMAKLEDVMRLVTFSDEEALPQSLKDHPLKGVFKGSRELHVENDWLLIYKSDNEAVVFERTGKHDELF